MFVLLFPVSTNTVRVLWGLTVLPIAIIVPVLFACIAVIPESTGHGTKLWMQVHNARWISSQCFWRSSQDTLTSLKNQQKGRGRIPPALGHALLPKAIFIAECSHFYQTKSPHWSNCNELWLQKAHTLHSAATFGITGVGTSPGTELVFGLVLPGKAGSLGVKLNVRWLPIRCQKEKEKYPLARLPQKS